MTRWMALDVGAKKIGVALSDPLRVAARPLATLKRKNLEADVEAVGKLAREHGVERIVVGRPIYLTGEESETLALIQPLFERLQAHTPFTVVWAEERLSTKEAERLMRELKVPREQRLARRDEFAAALILQWYLEESARD